MSYNGRDLTIVMLIIALTIMLNVGFFSNPDVAVKAVKRHAYTDVTVINHTWFFLGLRWGSPSGYMSRFTVEALNVNREPATLVVYTGWLFDPVVKFTGTIFIKK
ncbi:MAG: hypothetical protein U1A25_00140 [Candidatus Sungbacteria bacterium]|nr:hypothetical protein [bacterium]MDZ4260052.1 hypothetical protein [Candidatus Sungbacteria bacterium]